MDTSPSVRQRSSLAALVIPIPFFGAHLFALAAVLYYGWSWSGLALAVAFYYLRIFFVTGFYHRYFSHRTFKTSRVFQFLMALACTFTAQKGAIWWASHHRRHHKYSDVEGDVHSAKRDGFWWSHVGWIVSPRFDKTEESRVADLLVYPELRWLERYHLVPLVAYASLFYFVGGMHALVWGFFVSTVMLWHGTFTINSLTHMFGSRRYATGDDSRNNWILAIVTNGEGWHNNHHYYQASTRQGFMWWEIDVTYYLLRALAAVRLVWDLREPPKHLVAQTIEAARAAELARASEAAPAALDAVAVAAAVAEPAE